MAYGIPEFPGTNYGENSWHEFIELYKKIVGDYEGTLTRIEALDNRLTEYEANMQSQLERIQYVVVPNAVDVAVSSKFNQEFADIRLELQTLKADMTNLQNSYQSFASDVIGSVGRQWDTIREFQTRTNEQISDIDRKVSKAYNSCLEHANNLFDRSKRYAEEIGGKVAEESKEALDMVEAELYVKIDETRDELDKAIFDSFAAMMGRLKSLDKRLSERIDEVAKTSGSDAIKWLWDYACCAGGYSAYQWDMDSEITCEMWDKSGITCVEWYTKGREFFHWFERRQRMFSPISGKLMRVQDVVYELCEKLKVNAITAAEYDALQLKAGELMPTCAEYDWEGKITFSKEVCKECSQEKQHQT